MIRVKPKDLAAAGIQRVPRVVGVRDGRPLLEDGRVLDVANVIWCGGFHPGFDWIDLPVFDDDGELLHQGGVVESQPGLYFVGLTFLYAMSSSMIHGVSRDAARIVKAIKVRLGTAPSRTAPSAPQRLSAGRPSSSVEGRGRHGSDRAVATAPLRLSGDQRSAFSRISSALAQEPCRLSIAATCRAKT